MKPLRPHQERAMSLLRQSLASGCKRPMLQAPTGFGKTRIAAEIINGAQAKGKRVIFTVPAIELVDQTALAFWDEGIREIGVMQADHAMTDSSRPVQIASVQTLRRRHVPPADVVVIDEAHRMDKFVTEWMERDEWVGVPFIGLSATPWTKGLGRLYDRLIIASTTAELIRDGYLSPFIAFGPSSPDLSKVRTVAGDYHEGDLSKAMTPLVADVVTTWLAKGENRPTLCFAVDRAHARQLQEKFTAAGVPTGYVDKDTSKDERKRLREGFADGSIKVVCNVGVLTTGVDWDVRCIILARPTKSEILYTQIIGRGLRTADGKDHLLILDHSDTIERLGYVTDIQHDRLNDGTMATSKAGGEQEPPKPRKCPQCKFLVPAKVYTCPQCGFKGQRQAKVTTVEGELVDLDARRRNRDADWAAKRLFIGGLRRHAQVNGKSDGWVNHSYRERFGVWPNDPKVKYAPASDKIAAEVASWITAKNIRFAKGRGRKRA